MSAIRGGEIQAGDVIVIRYEGPKGRPGMREMVDITRTLSSIGCEDKVALITDGRFQGIPAERCSGMFPRRRRRADRSR